MRDWKYHSEDDRAFADNQDVYDPESDGEYDDESGGQDFDDNEKCFGEDEEETPIDQNDLGANINELFWHIYNEEAESVEKLKKIVFP